MITQYRPAYYDNPRAAQLAGRSIDTKPIDVENGARYEEIDTGRVFCFDKEHKTWYEMPESGGGGGSSVSVEPITIEENGTTTAPDGVAYSPVTVNIQPNLQEKSVTITENGTTDVTPDTGVDGISKVTINTAVPVPETEEKSVNITNNGNTSVTPSTGKVLSKVDITVNVPSTPVEERSASLSMASGNQVVTARSGYVMSKVTIEKPSTLIPDNIKKDVNIGGVVGTLESGGGTDTVVYQGNLVAAEAGDDYIVFAIQEGQFPAEMMSQIAAEASQIFIFSTPGVIPANGFLYKGSPSDSLFIVNANAVGTPSYEVDASNNAIVLSGLSGAGEVQVGSAYYVRFVAPSID